MPQYTYRAKDGPERTVDGRIDAESRQAVLSHLDALGLSPVWIREGDAGGGGRRVWMRIPLRDVTVLTLQLASLTRAGVPILRALRTVREQTANARLQRVMEEIEGVVREGGLLSDGMSRHPRLFSQLYVDLVRAGESAGMLDVSLVRLAEAREKEDEVRRKVQAAVAYPVLVLAVGAVTVFVLLSFFLPKVIALFENFERLPLPTRILVQTSNFFSQTWHWFLIVIVLLAAVVYRLFSAQKGRMLMDSLLLRIPFVRTVVRESEMGRFARTLSLLLKAGVPIDRALRLGGGSLRNSIMRSEIERVRDSVVQRGMPLSEGVRRLTGFSSFFANMAAVGEEGGGLDASLDEIASFYEKQVEQRARLATSLIEPILILVVGAIVGFIVAAMLLPVFELRTGF